MRAVAEDPVGDPDRSDAHLDAGPARALPGDVGRRRHRVRGMRIGVRVAPGPVLAGDGQLALDPLVVGLQVGVRDRPVLPDAVTRARLEVRRVEPWGVARVVHHRPADPVSGVVLAQFDRVLSSDDPGRRPVELVLAGLVRDPVTVGVPERSGLEDDHAPARATQALREDRAAGPGADDHDVDLVVVGVPGHVLAVGTARRWTSSRRAESLSSGRDRALGEARRRVIAASLAARRSRDPPRRPPDAPTAHGSAAPGRRRMYPRG